MHARGLWQGDPIAPMLFVVVMEVLNSLIIEADRRHVLSLLQGSVITQRASLYADDLVVFLAPKARNLNCLKAILECFAESLLSHHACCLPLQFRVRQHNYVRVFHDLIARHS